MKAVTVGQLLEEGVRVTHSCQWCKFHEETNLARICREKGPDVPMMDRLPLCTNGDCRGMLRFMVYRGCRSEWLMTKAGDAKFQAHSDWMFATRSIERRRQALRTSRNNRD